MNEMIRLVVNSITPIIILTACNKRVFCVLTNTLWNGDKLFSQSVVVSSKAIPHIFLINLKICLDSYSCQSSSLQASSPIWASETSLARTRERAAKPRGARFGCPNRRACSQAITAVMQTLDLVSSSHNYFGFSQHHLGYISDFVLIKRL